MAIRTACRINFCRSSAPFDLEGYGKEGLMPRLAAVPIVNPALRAKRPAVFATSEVRQPLQWFSGDGDARAYRGQAGQLPTSQSRLARERVMELEV